ncbi:MAG TPA: bacillithiol biosynthesis BshC [Thermoanaerobaculia bacterium]|nr:bacillithiol biosynthesis BshC [Thermoanaerobaculia bacterium]
MKVPLAHYPGMNRFVLDWLGGDTRFLPRGTAPRRDKSPRSAALANALIESNQKWGLFVREDVERWQRGEGVTLVAGQQVGFAGGPLYTLAKIASLVKMKRELEAAGTPATVFFWLATEDHDIDEVATLALPIDSKQRNLAQIRVSTPREHVAVGPQRIPEALVTELLALLPMPRPSWLREGITFGDSFAELIASVFPRDVVLVDALLPELRRAGEPLFRVAFGMWDAMQRALRDRSAALQHAGYTPQVVPREEDGAYTLFFALEENGTRRVIDDPARVDLPPERISTSAITRPLLQDFVLQPDIFLGGPAEVAYYAQLAPLHEMLAVTMPRVALRAHALVAPKRVLRAIDRYGITADELFAEPDAILAEREPEGVAKIRALADDARRDLIARIEQIGELALPADHSLSGKIHRSIGHIEYHFDKLTERAIKGLVRKDRDRYAAVREAVATLHPDGHVQDRIVSWFAFWCTSGPALVEQLIANVEPDSSVFNIVEL